jgi:HSP20 family protein
MKSLMPWKRRGEEGGSTALTESPRDSLRQMRRELESLFDRFLGGWPMAAGRDWPMTELGFDVDDTENELVVRADAPGFEPDDFNVEIVGDNLVLRAEHKEETKKGNARHYRSGRLYRSMTLPHSVEPEKIDARYHSGVLEIHVPKGEEAKGKRIEVKAV